jgi:hypothetical protein
VVLRRNNTQAISACTAEDELRIEVTVSKGERVMGKTFKIDEQDIEVATWKIAELLIGPSDTSQQRIELEKKLHATMVTSFQTTVKPESKNLLAAFKRMAQGICDCVGEDDDGDLYLDEEGAYWYGCNWMFEVAARLGPEFVRALDDFGFRQAEEYNEGRYDFSESEQELATFEECQPDEE